MADFSRLHSVADIPRIHAADRPNAIALDFNGRATTYGALDAHASRVAQGLIALGQKPGARATAKASSARAMRRCAGVFIT